MGDLGRTARRTIGTGVLVTAIVVATAAAAGAHIEPDPARVKPGKEATVAFTVEHGCKKSPTTKLTFKIPKGAKHVSGVAKDGWDATTANGTVVFEGGPLDAETEDSFEITFTAPDKKTLLTWKVVQKCEKGTIRWIDTSEGAEETPPVVGVGKNPPEEHDE